MQRLGFGLLALALAGCASGVPVERQVVVPGGRFDSVRGEASFFVRTFLAGEERREVVGVPCTLVSSLYTADLVAPSRVVVPNFGPQSPELTVTCRTGDLSGTGQARIVTRWQDPPGYWGPGLYGPGLWGRGFYGPGAPVGAWGWYGPSYPVSDYPDLRVVLQ